MCDSVVEAAGHDLAKHAVGIVRKGDGEGIAFGAVEGAPRFEKIGAVERPTRTPPPFPSDRMPANGAENVGIGLALELGTRRRGRPMAKLDGSLDVGSPPSHLGLGCVAERIVQPPCAQPATRLVGREAKRDRPAAKERHDALDVRRAQRRHDCPRRQVVTPLAVRRGLPG